MIKVLIVDDHMVVRDGLASILGRVKDIEVVGEATNGREAIQKFDQTSPDVVLMDLRMPDMNGVEAMRHIRERYPQAKFLVLTTFDTDEYIFDAIEAGAKGYLLKDASREDLFQAVHAVSRGESLIHPGIATKVLNRLTQLSSRTPSVVEGLSDREIQVLQLMSTGAANKEIAASLSITESTVKTHVANIFGKLEASDRTQAVTLAIQKGIIKI